MKITYNLDDKCSSNLVLLDHQLLKNNLTQNIEKMIIIHYIIKS